MPEESKPGTKPADGHVGLGQPGSPSWTTGAKTGIATLAGLVTLAATIEPLVQQFTKSSVTSIELTLAGTACVAVLVGAGAYVYFYRKRNVPMLTVPAVILVCMAMAAVALVAWPKSSTGSPLPPKGWPAAVKELDSPQLNVRLSGISKLQRLIRADPGEQGEALEKLCAFIRRESPAGPNDSGAAADIQAALGVIDHRNPAHDDGVVIDLDNANLTGANLTNADLDGASISGSNGADLTDADLAHADLNDTNLANSYFGDALLTGTELTSANLDGASFFQTPLCSPHNVPVHPAANYNCAQ